MYIYILFKMRIQNCDEIIGHSCPYKFELAMILRAELKTRLLKPHFFSSQMFLLAIHIIILTCTYIT